MAENLIKKMLNFGPWMQHHLACSSLVSWNGQNERKTKTLRLKCVNKSGEWMLWEQRSHSRLQVCGCLAVMNQLWLISPSWGCRSAAVLLYSSSGRKQHNQSQPPLLITTRQRQRQRETKTYNSCFTRYLTISFSFTTAFIPPGVCRQRAVNLLYTCLFKITTLKKERCTFTRGI